MFRLGISHKKRLTGPCGDIELAMFCVSISNGDVGQHSDALFRAIVVVIRQDVSAWRLEEGLEASCNAAADRRSRSPKAFFLLLTPS